uniref:Uncharacterized protein n=1 Tax=Glossina palpalis gambiensis TaxID=67801 RepID=A0A1B0BDM7_9MUSC
MYYKQQFFLGFPFRTCYPLPISYTLLSVNATESHKASTTKELSGRDTNCSHNNTTLNISEKLSLINFYVILLWKPSDPIFLLEINYEGGSTKKFAADQGVDFSNMFVEICPYRQRQSKNDQNSVFMKQAPDDYVAKYKIKHVFNKPQPQTIISYKLNFSFLSFRAQDYAKMKRTNRVHTPLNTLVCRVVFCLHQVRTSNNCRISVCYMAVV